MTRCSIQPGKCVHLKHAKQNKRKTQSSTHTTPFSHSSLLCPKSPVLCLRGVNVSGCWIVIFECSLWDELRVNIWRIGTVSQSVNQAVILSDRWFRKDPWYHVQKRSELLFTRRRTKEKVIQSDGNINEPKFIWPAAYRWQTSRLCAETPCSSFIQRVKSSSKDTHVCMYVTVWVRARGRVSGQVNARELFFHCHIFGMAVLCPRLLHSWWISMQCGVVTETGADMLSHCDEKHSEMMWRECSSCPQRDGKLAVAFVYSFVPPWLCENACVCEYFLVFL